MNRKILFVIASLLTCLAGFSPNQPPAAARSTEWKYLFLPAVLRPSQIVYKDPATYVVDKYVTVTNTNFTLSKLEIYMPGATAWDSQTISAIAFYPALTAQTPDEHGNQVLYWNLSGTPAPGQTLDIGERFTVTVYAIEAQIDPADVKPYDTASTLYQRYTLSERNIEANDSSIILAAAAAVGGETNPYLMAERIYQYIAAHLFYLDGPGFQGAKLTLELGSGECGDYATLFVAMARAVGIPARPVVGYHAYSGEQYHVWAEFYLQGIGWVPVDAQAGDMGDTASPWSFGNNPNTRITLTKNINITLAPSTYNAALFQTYYYWYWGSGSGLGVTGGWEVTSP